MTRSQQDLLRLLAEYRRRLEQDGNADTAALLRALIAEIGELERAQDGDSRPDG